MNEHLTRRMKKVEELSGVKMGKQHKVIIIKNGESKEQACAQEGFDPNDPDVKVIRIHLVAPGERVTSVGPSESG